MLTGRPGVAAVGVFVATVSVLGLCFKVWPGDYQLNDNDNESKSAKMTLSQPYKLQPAMHLQPDENEKASMRKTVLDLHGAVVKFNALFENVTPPTSEILSQNTKAVTGDNTYTLSGTGCTPENAIKSVEECKTAATAMGKKWWQSFDSVHHAPGCHVDYESVGFNTNPGRKASCMSEAEMSDSCMVDGKYDEASCMSEPLCICRGTAAAATGGKKLDKAHRMCLNTRLNELDATYETSLVDYKAKKGEDFVEGPVTQWSTAYANADADQSLADEDFLKVATAKANFDGLFFYLKTSHAIEICDFTAKEANKEAVKANPVLFSLPESKCAKAISAVADFEDGAGKDLLSKCN